MYTCIYFIKIIFCSTTKLEIIVLIKNFNHDFFTTKFVKGSLIKFQSIKFKVSIYNKHFFN